MRRSALLLVVSLSLAALCPATRAGDDRRSAGCARVEARISEVRLRLRMGYTTRQGRLYRQRLAGLEVERRAQCP
ncbi:MAG: hypothetical protein KJ041_09715 [Gammaproteobacteria bacterium]|nr:hypothetical protein [Gammaproteobacteria bacterium]